MPRTRDERPASPTARLGRSALWRLLEANRRTCMCLNRVWGYPRRDFWARYDQLAGDEVRRRAEPTVVDVGAGRETPYAALLRGHPHRLVGVDVLADHVAGNAALHERVALDLLEDEWPFQGNVDVLTSRMVLEHLADVRVFADKVSAALAPGGCTLHLFAGRYSLFAIANRVLPDRAARAILFALRPISVEVGGFTAHYDRTNPSAITTIFEHSGLRVRSVLVSYEISSYFWFCLPLFVLARIFETIVTAIDRHDLASYVIVVAERPAKRSAHREALAPTGSGPTAGCDGIAP